VTTPLHAPLSTRKAVQLIAEAHALGVPLNHGSLRNLKRVREATSLTFVGADTQGRPQWLTPRAARAWTRMRDAAASNDVMLEIVSAFRSVEYQLGIIRRKIERGLSMDEILRVSAAPGYSEHHSGRAFDLTTPNYAALEEDFENSPAFAWLSTNAKLYGFTMSYPRGNPHGIAYEPWHWCWHAKT
jgi:zinc D-Ala-D-Ala carboxypeptidase